MIEFIKYLISKKSPDHKWWTVIFCRLRNHPKGVIWFNASGLEPNMTCKICGDDLS